MTLTNFKLANAVQYTKAKLSVKPYVKKNSALERTVHSRDGVLGPYGIQLE